MTSGPELSVIVVSWNARALLVDCLRSVRAALADGPPLTAEVFVVDNGSADGSPETVARAFPEVCLIRNDRNRGFAAANNQALERAAGRYLLLLNSDTVVPVDALAGLTAALDAHPEAAVCGPLLRNGDGSLQISWARFPDTRAEWTGALDRSQAPLPPERLPGAAPFAVDWIGGACFMVRADDVRRSGPLDEGFFFFSEELEWCLRFARRGRRTLLVPSVEVVHRGGGSSKTAGKAVRRWLWRSRLRFYRLAYGPVRGALPALVATGRYVLSGLRRAAA